MFWSKANFMFLRGVKCFGKIFFLGGRVGWASYEQCLHHKLKVFENNPNACVIDQGYFSEHYTWIWLRHLGFGKSPWFWLNYSKYYPKMMKNKNLICSTSNSIYLQKRLIMAIFTCKAPHMCHHHSCCHLLH